MKFFSVVFTAALATAVLAAPVEVAERQVESESCLTSLHCTASIIPFSNMHMVIVHHEHHHHHHAHTYDHS